MHSLSSYGPTRRAIPFNFHRSYSSEVSDRFVSQSYGSKGPFAHLTIVYPKVEEIKRERFGCELEQWKEMYEYPIVASFQEIRHVKRHFSNKMARTISPRPKKKTPFQKRVDKFKPIARIDKSERKIELEVQDYFRTNVHKRSLVDDMKGKTRAQRRQREKTLANYLLHNFNDKKFTTGGFEGSDMEKPEPKQYTTLGRWRIWELEKYQKPERIWEHIRKELEEDGLLEVFDIHYRVGDDDSPDQDSQLTKDLKFFREADDPEGFPHIPDRPALTQSLPVPKVLPYVPGKNIDGPLPSPPQKLLNGIRAYGVDKDPLGLVNRPEKKKKNNRLNKVSVDRPIAFENTIFATTMKYERPPFHSRKIIMRISLPALKLPRNVQQRLLSLLEPGEYDESKKQIILISQKKRTQPGNKQYVVKRLRMLLSEAWAADLNYIGPTSIPKTALYNANLGVTHYSKMKPIHEVGKGPHNLGGDRQILLPHEQIELEEELRKQEEEKKCREEEFMKKARGGGEDPFQYTLFRFYSVPNAVSLKRQRGRAQYLVNRIKVKQ